MNLRYISFMLLMGLICFSSCSVKKQIAEPSAYQSLSLRGQVALNLDDHQYTMNCVARVWHNELIVLSLQPMLGIEMVRAEATPNSVVVFDKLNRRYAAMDYASINRLVKPKISYQRLQEFVEQPTQANNESAKMIFKMGKHQLALSCKWQNIEQNTLPQAKKTNTDKYKLVTLRELLPL